MNNKLNSKMFLRGSLFCLIVGGALLVGTLRTVRSNPELFNPLLAALLLLVVAWNLLHVAYVYKKNN